MSGLNLFLRYYAVIVVSVWYAGSVYLGIVEHTSSLFLEVILVTMVLYDVMLWSFSCDRRPIGKRVKGWIKAFRKKRSRTGADWYTQLHRGLKEQ